MVLISVVLPNLRKRERQFDIQKYEKAKTMKFNTESHFLNRAYYLTNINYIWYHDILSN